MTRHSSLRPDAALIVVDALRSLSPFLSRVRESACRRAALLLTN